MIRKNPSFAIPLLFLFFFGTNGTDAQFDQGEGDEEEKVWSLRECIDHAYENNLQVAQQELSVESSDLDRKQSYYELLPNLNAFGSHGYNWGQRVDPFTNQFVTRRVRSNNFNLSSELVLFDGMRRYRSIQQAEYDLEGEKARVEQTKNDVALEIANAYLQVLFNKELLKVAEEQRELTRMQMERMKDLHDAGEVSKGEYLDMQAQWESERSNVVQSENDLDLSRLQLIQTLRLEGDEARQFAVEAPPADEHSVDSLNASPSEIYNRALQEMPSIRAAELQIRSAEEEMAIAQGGRSPSLNVNGSYGTGYSGMREEMAGDPELVGYDTVGITAPSGEAVLTPQFDQETRKVPFWEQVNDNLNQNLNLQLSIPIFQRMSTNTRIKKARIGVRQAQLEKESTRNQLRQDVRQAYADAMAAQRKFDAAQKAVEAREESFSYAEARYEAGAINTVDFVDAKTKLAQARSDLLQAKYEQLFKRKVLRFYLGEELSLEAETP